MPSFLSLLCCCARHGSRSDEDSIDETSRLIPSNLEATPSPTVTFTDHQRIQERLVTIVRAKERKMVNVTSQIPFNLHNRVITPNPSLSRSVSLSKGLHDSVNPTYPSFDAREALTVQLRSPPSPLGSAPNDSHPQSRSISQTRDPADAKPILNVRLVTATPSSAPQRVGRPRHRAYGSPTSAEYPSVSGTQSSAGDAAKPPTSPSDTSKISSPPQIKPLDEICWSWGD